MYCRLEVGVYTIDVNLEHVFIAHSLKINEKKDLAVENNNRAAFQTLGAGSQNNFHHMNK